MPGIIWLASYPKSGNTWLRAFLANYMKNDRKPVPINDLPSFILGDNLLLHYGQFTGRDAEQLSPEEIARLRPQIHQWFAASAKQDVFVKTHNAVCVVEGAPIITPAATAGAIYVVRNPLDVAVSFAHHYQISYDRAVESLGDESYCLPAANGLLPQYLTSWSKHVKSWTEAPGLTRHVLRYEDMLDRPLKAMGELVRFLGLPKDIPRLKRAVRFSSFEELSRQEKQERFVESRPDGKTAFFRKGKAGSWREVLSEEQAGRLIDRHREVMAEMGYLDATGEPVA